MGLNDRPKYARRKYRNTMYNCCTNNGCCTWNNTAVNAFRRGFDLGFNYGVQLANGNGNNGYCHRHCCYNTCRRCCGYTTYPLRNGFTTTDNTNVTTCGNGYYTGGYGGTVYGRNGGCGCNG